MHATPLDKRAMRIVKLDAVGDDFAYWQSVPYEARLAALESIRNEYITWKYGAEPRLQRVCRVIKPA